MNNKYLLLEKTIRKVSFDDIRKIIHNLTGENLNDIKPNSYLQKDLGFDSLDLVELIMAIEKEFDLEIPEEIIHNLKDSTVSQVVDAINKLIDETNSKGKMFVKNRLMSISKTNKIVKL